MDGVIYAEETAGVHGGPESDTKLLRPPLSGSGLTSAFRAFSGYPASRKTSRTDLYPISAPTSQEPLQWQETGSWELATFRIAFHTLYLTLLIQRPEMLSD